MYKEETKTNASAHNSGPRPLQDPRMQSKYGTRERLGKGFVKQMSFKCGEKDWGSDDSEDGDCDEVMCASWGEPEGEWTHQGWRNVKGSWFHKEGDFYMGKIQMVEQG